MRRESETARTQDATPLRARGLQSRLSHAEYRAALEEIEALLDDDPAEGSEAHDRLGILFLLVEAYEAEHERPGRVTPQDAVSFMLEQRGMTRTDLNRLMGGKSRVSEFFAGKRDLSKAQIEALHRTLGIPAEALLGLGGRGA